MDWAEAWAHYGEKATAANRELAEVTDELTRFVQANERGGAEAATELRRAVFDVAEVRDAD